LSNYHITVGVIAVALEPATNNLPALRLMLVLRAGLDQPCHLAACLAVMPQAGPDAQLGGGGLAVQPEKGRDSFTQVREAVRARNAFHEAKKGL
jgi:hypothetical protein